MAQRDNMRAIFDSVADGIFTIDTQLRVTNGNESFKEMIHCPEELKPSCTIAELFSVRGGALEVLLERTLQGERVRQEDVEIRPVSGGALVAALQAAPLLDTEGKVGGAVVVLHDVTRMRSLEDELRLASGPEGLVGRNVRMLEIYRLIDQLADNDVSVLITGESGTGKEVVASAIHARSHRRERPFVRVNCAALSETLLESELFGHVRGAFTGAIRDRKGRFEAAHRGTIFLDEVGAVSLEVQKRLLRVLQERQFERVGEERTQEVDVRVIAATNADLKQMVSDGSFREDLYYRLNVVHLHVPALRERREDIPALAEHLLRRHAEAMGRGRMSFDSEALSLLMAYRWEGNVRQLENAVQRALVVSKGRVIRPQHLPPEILRQAGGSHPGGSTSDPNTLSASQAELLRALEEADGKLGRAAQKLGIHRTTLWRRLKRHGLHSR
jgi:PAS domain S-box-containing protein